mmetsp:Transcript_13051/g.19878  ORF Transcript_13051/g.19878 Transcript_13051/m.19878 type:complete len:740 (+) Transcript_13051:2-2221(+)
MSTRMYHGSNEKIHEIRKGREIDDDPILPSCARRSEEKSDVSVVVEEITGAAEEEPLAGRKKRKPASSAMRMNDSGFFQRKICTNEIDKEKSCCEDGHGADCNSIVGRDDDEVIDVTELSPDKRNKKRICHNKNGEIYETATTGGLATANRANDEQWTLRLEELREYKRREGTCNVPRQPAENRKLSIWVMTQRKQYKLRKEGKRSSMTEDRIALLEAEGFMWARDHDTWDERLRQLRLYKAEFGDCQVPKEYKPNPKLGYWVKTQRTQYNLLKKKKRSTMTATRIKALEAVGFSWNGYTNRYKSGGRSPVRNDKKWLLRYRELQAYREEHGNCLVPAKYEGNPQLGYWVNNQRQQYRLKKRGKPSLITQDRIDMLTMEGFVWDVNCQKSFEERLEELKEYKAQFGDCLVPSSYEENPQLGPWVMNQRNQYKRYKMNLPAWITKEKIDALDALGFIWESRDDAWGKRYTELKAFKEATGTCKVPSRYDANPQLGNWVAKQRRQYNMLTKGEGSTMTQAQLTALESIGFIWDLRDTASWDDRVEELRLYKNETGHCLVPRHYPSNPQLGQWVSTQRVQYRLMQEGKGGVMTPERASLLDSLDFIWNDSNENDVDEDIHEDDFEENVGSQRESDHILEHSSGETRETVIDPNVERMECETYGVSTYDLPEDIPTNERNVQLQPESCSSFVQETEAVIDVDVDVSDEDVKQGIGCMCNDDSCTPKSISSTDDCIVSYSIADI